MRLGPALAIGGWLLVCVAAQVSCGVLTAGDCAERLDCPEHAVGDVGTGAVAGDATDDARSDGAASDDDAASRDSASTVDALLDASPIGNHEASVADAVGATDVADGFAVSPPNACGVPSTLVSSPVIYDGAMAATCQTNIPAPRNGFWFAYNEPNPNDAAVGASAMGAMPGCNGPSDCSIHATGSGFTLYAGVGFNFNGGANDNTAYDASAYSGIEFWARGIVTGSRSGDVRTGFTPVDQTMFVELVSAINRPNGDEYGAYCSLAGDGVSWSHCQVDFASVKRLGFAAPPDAGPDTFDRAALYKLQFQFSPFMGSTRTPAKTVAFDVSIDDVFFY